MQVQGRVYALTVPRRVSRRGLVRGVKAQPQQGVFRRGRTGAELHGVGWRGLFPTRGAQGVQAGFQGAQQHTQLGVLIPQRLTQLFLAAQHIKKYGQDAEKQRKINNINENTAGLPNCGPGGPGLLL